MQILSVLSLTLHKAIYSVTQTLMRLTCYDPKIEKSLEML